MFPTFENRRSIQVCVESFDNDANVTWSGSLPLFLRRLVSFSETKHVLCVFVALQSLYVSSIGHFPGQINRQPLCLALSDLFTAGTILLIKQCRTSSGFVTDIFCTMMKHWRSFLLFTKSLITQIYGPFAYHSPTSTRIYFSPPYPPRTSNSINLINYKLADLPGSSSWVPKPPPKTGRGARRSEKETPERQKRKANRALSLKALVYRKPPPPLANRSFLSNQMRRRPSIRG